VITPRQQVLDAIQKRPTDPWPRGQGHVVLARPGTTEDEKAYHEPGGSFSPAFATFGISIWVVDRQGGLLSTSDSLPLEQIQQRFAWPEPNGIPALVTDTPYYTATWSAGETRGSWALDLQAKGASQLALVVRSVGPSGAAMSALGWSGKKLRVNDRWEIAFSGKPDRLQAGPEAIHGDLRPKPGEQVWQSDAGWGFARCLLAGTKPWHITVKDEAPATNAPPQLECRQVFPPVKLEVPDQAFKDCLQAQVAHLAIGLVRNETRPGEPNNYPLMWLRDGAYTVVALARAGHIDLARQLAVPFAEKDFFGGFGAEADAPGLALWVLGEVARLAGDSRFDRTLYPHVQRKAAIISEMLSATQPIHKAYHGPIVPRHAQARDLDLVCDPAKDGLIAGKMDWHRPVLFVNAVSYRGLTEAARFATRLGERSVAQRWQDQAGALRGAWNQALARPEFENERTYVCGLYPTWVATNLPLYAAKLEDFWRKSRDVDGSLKGTPLWTYFNLATAHQWLMLGQPERVWRDLRWFWAHQTSPGLYTWWESNGEENNFGRWANMARGWVNPPHVTPHYWTAAEMLLLQEEMLAYVDESKAGPVLVVGAGIPREWLDYPLTVKGLGTSLGWLDMTWRDRKLTLRLKGPKCGIVLGPAFAPGTDITASFSE
jgi:hypothetical protein